MKQVRFDTPRRSDSRLYSHEHKVDSECETPRAPHGNAPRPTAVTVPEAINNLHACSPVQRYEINPTPQAAIGRTVFPIHNKRLSVPCSDLELSAFEGNNNCASTRRASADDCRYQQRKSVDTPYELSTTLKQKEYVDVSNGIKSGLDFNEFGAKTLMTDHQLFSNNLQESNTVFNKQFHTFPSQTRVDPSNLPVPKLYHQRVTRCSRNTCNCHDCAINNNDTHCIHRHCCPPVNVQPVRSCCQPYQHDILEPSLIFNNNNHNQHLCHRNETMCKPIINNSCGHQIISQNNTQEKSAIEKQSNVAIDSREPTVSDLFKIIQLQNEQLKILQNQVDKLLAAQTNSNPIQNYVQERMSIEAADHHKISIGVMTSFEVIKSKERIKNNQILTRSYDNLNKVDVSDNASGNFLEGINPVDRDSSESDESSKSSNEVRTHSETEVEDVEPNEKTVNELSLCNLLLDNAITPQLSPDQSIYIDLKDYSGSEDDRSAVGWTYYNKVMNHVNEMLEESDQPSSAAGLHRRAVEMAGGLLDRHRPHSDGCADVHVDRTDLSITKRVTFKEQAFHLRPAVSSDTSLQINRLAAKYLRQAPRPPEPLDVSVATRRYMEQHNIIKESTPRPTAVPSRILDITALKQQPKLL